MSIATQRRGGTTLEHSTFTGLVRELTVDTTKKTVVVHDGVTAGGVPLLKEESISTWAKAGTKPAYTGTEISNTPAGSIAATTLQAAINELDGEKQAALVSGISIKTINSASILGAGDITTVQILNDLTDVVIATPIHGQGLKYDSVTSVWKNDAISGGSTIALIAKLQAAYQFGGL
jgi:hypothetical protein